MQSGKRIQYKLSGNQKVYKTRHSLLRKFCRIVLIVFVEFKICLLINNTGCTLCTIIYLQHWPKPNDLLQ